MKASRLSSRLSPVPPVKRRPIRAWHIQPTVSPPKRTFHMRATPFSTLPIVLAAVLATGIPAFAEDGVSADKIVFGQAAALDGAASALGLGMKMGLEAAFAEINKAGGVKGRKLELKSVDDGYEPTKSIEAVKKLLEEDKVFAIAGAVGTPTAAATQPIATAAGAPFIGAFTGAEFLREPYKPLVLNIRASYFQETEAMVEHLTKNLGASKIAILYQDDATAVIMISPYKPAAEFIKLAKQIKFDATFVNISFVGSDAIAKELGPVGAGVVITQVVPFPKDAAIPVVGHYQASLKASAPDAQPGFVSLEGYLVGRAIIAALEKVSGDLTRQALIEAVQKAGTLDLDGFKLGYSPSNNRASDHVSLTHFQPAST